MTYRENHVHEVLHVVASKPDIKFCVAQPGASQNDLIFYMTNRDPGREKRVSINSSLLLLLSHFLILPDKLLLLILSVMLLDESSQNFDKSSQTDFSLRLWSERANSFAGTPDLQVADLLHLGLKLGSVVLLGRVLEGAAGFLNG